MAGFHSTAGRALRRCALVLVLVLRATRAGFCPNEAFSLGRCVVPGQVVRSRPELRRPRHPSQGDIDRLLGLVRGKRALEIGGPSNSFLAGLYDALGRTDNVVAPDQHAIFARPEATGTARYVAQGAGRGEVLRADAETLDLGDGRGLGQAPFELVVAIHVLEHMVDPIKALVAWK